jgi:hypothetical protein
MSTPTVLGKPTTAVAVVFMLTSFPSLARASPGHDIMPRRLRRPPAAARDRQRGTRPRPHGGAGVGGPPPPLTAAPAPAKGMPPGGAFCWRWRACRLLTGCGPTQ